MKIKQQNEKDKLLIHIKQVRVRHSALDAESPNDNPLFTIRLRIKSAMTNGIQLAFPSICPVAGDPVSSTGRKSSSPSI